MGLLEHKEREREREFANCDTMELPVGLCGIFKLTIHIIRRNLKHFLCIAVMLALPSAVLLALSPSRTSVAQTIAQTISHYPSHGDGMPTQPPPPYPYLIAIFVVFILSSLVAQPTLTFSTCRAVFNKSLACERSLLAVPLSALNLLLTGLCVLGVQLGLVVVGMLILMIIMAAGLSTLSKDPTIVIVIWTVVMAGGMMYVGIVCVLTSAVAILEGKRGWEAVKRSSYLIHGSMWVAFSLGVVLGVCSMFLPISAADEASGIWRWSCVVLSLVLQDIVGLLSAASMVVLYLSCRSRLKEPLDALIALDPRFGPPETSAKYADIESAHVDTV